MTEVYEVVIAPPGARCDLCFCDCAGEPCEMTVVDGKVRYSHVDLVACLARWEEAGADVSEVGSG